MVEEYNVDDDLDALDELDDADLDLMAACYDIPIDELDEDFLEDYDEE
jgi:hypothetical protein